MAKHIKCRKCGGSIEWNSTKCIWCGGKNRFKLRLAIWGIIGILFGLPFFTAIIIPAITSGNSGEAVGAVVVCMLLALLVWILAKARKRNFIICYNTNCGYRGQGKLEGADNGCLLLLLFCCGIFPAILYILFCGKKSLICPQCGCKIR